MSPFPYFEASAPAESALSQGVIASAASGAIHVTAAVAVWLVSCYLVPTLSPPQGNGTICLNADFESAAVETSIVGSDVEFDSEAVEGEREPLPQAMEPTREAAETEVFPPDVQGHEPLPNRLPPHDQPERRERAATEQPAIAVESHALQPPPRSVIGGPLLSISAGAVGLQMEAQPGKDYAPAPAYPAAALAARQEGIVKLRVAIDAVGHVRRASVVQTSGFEALDDAALAAVRTWRFTPARVQGHAIATEVRVPVRFQLAP